MCLIRASCVRLEFARMKCPATAMAPILFAPPAPPMDDKGEVIENS